MLNYEKKKQYIPFRQRLRPGPIVTATADKFSSVKFALSNACWTTFKAKHYGKAREKMFPRTEIHYNSKPTWSIARACASSAILGETPPYLTSKSSLNIF